MIRRSAASLLSTYLLGFCCLNAWTQRVIQVPSGEPTIQAGIDAAFTGDTVLVAPGTYAENIDFHGKGIVVTSNAQTLADAAKTVIHGNTDGPVVSIVSGEPAGTQLNGFTIEHGYTQTAAVGRAGGVYIENASATLSRNNIQNNRGCGVGIVRASATILQSRITANTAHAAPQGPNQSYCATQGYGVYVEAAGAVEILASEIDHNQLDTSLPAGQQGAAAGGILIASGQSVSLSSSYIHDNDFGLRVGFGSFASLVKLTLINNLFYKQTVEPRAGYSSPYPVVTEVNNTFWGRGESFRLDPGTRYEKLLLLNNIFANTGTSFGLRTDGAAVLCTPNFGGATEIRAENNDFYSATNQPSNCAAGSGNISSAPSLRAPENGDVREQAGSPTLQAGTINAPGLPIADLDNKARTYCGTIDMGAYQYRPTTTILSASRNPVNGGDAVTFTAQVASQCEPPTGQVTFFDNGVPLASSTLNDSGRAQLQTSTLTVGDHAVTATYTGAFDESTSGGLTETVLGDPTTTTVTATPSPAAALSPITLRAVVTSTYGTPTGMVIFRASTSGILGSALLDAKGTATFISPGLSAGSYTIYADYSADIHFAASSGTTSLQVVAASSAISLLVAPPTASYGQLVTLIARVDASGSPTMGNATGSVAFFDGSRPLGSAALTPNGATIAQANFSVGDHVITARFGGSDSLAASSVSATLSVTPAAVALSLEAATATATINQGGSVAVAVAGTSPYGSLAGLQVVLREGTAVLLTAQLDGSGRVTLPLQNLAPGTHILQASSGATAMFASALSNSLTITVLAYDFSLSAPMSLAVPPGGYTYLTVTATPVGGFQGAIEVSCPTVPAHTQCVFGQGNSIVLNSTSGSLRIAVNASDVFGFGPLATRSKSSEGRLLFAVFFAPMLMLPGAVFGRGRGRVTLIMAVTAAALLLQSCSGKQPALTPPGTYNLTIAGSAMNGTAIHKQITVSLEVR